MLRLYLLGCILLSISTAIIMAQEELHEELHLASPPESSSPGEANMQNIIPRFQGRAVVLEIHARIVEQDQVVVWNESHRKPTIPGRPVGLRLVGANIVVAVQLTPYIRRNAQKFLVAQGQIWMDIPNEGLRYHTSMQTIPLEFGEVIYFFPLGPLVDENAASIEIMISLHPYEEP